MIEGRRTPSTLLVRVVRRFETFEATGVESMCLSPAPLPITRQILLFEEVLT
jgi:hypothetical protein